MRSIRILRKLCGSVWFWVSLGFIFVAGVAYFLWRRFQDRLENDPAFARRLKAVREARQALIPAGEYISSGNPKDFYALLSKVLRDYLANKWHQSSAALSVEAILGNLKKAKIDEVHITQVKTILEQADLVCFAGSSADSAKPPTPAKLWEPAGRFSSKARRDSMSSSFRPAKTPTRFRTASPIKTKSSEASLSASFIPNSATPPSGALPNSHPKPPSTTPPTRLQHHPFLPSAR